MGTKYEQSTLEGAPFKRSLEHTCTASFLDDRHGRAEICDDGRVAVVAQEAELHKVCQQCLRHGSPLCLYRPSLSLQSMRLRVFSSLWLWAFASFWLRRCTADRRLPISLVCERCSPGYTTADATRPLMELFLCTCVVLLSWLGFAAA